MYISCPRCQARFRVRDEQLGEHGRRVRCGCCRHSWMQSPAVLSEHPIDRLQAELMATFMLSAVSRASAFDFETVE